MTDDSWRDTVRIATEPMWEAEVVARLGQPPPEPSVWVTDLLDLRPAYFRRRFRVPTDRARKLRQAAGRDLHALIGSALAAPGYLEVRVRRQGIVGQIDLFEDAPTELKTTENLPEPESIRSTRGAYLDQLAMYCALTERPQGRLIVVEITDGRPGRCQVFEVGFRSIDALKEEMVGRAGVFRAADAKNSPEGLPRCAWFGRGCEFQEARVCDCTGEEPFAATRLRDEVHHLALEAGATRELEARLRALAEVAESPVVQRFRDLLYPRRAYFERREPGVDEEGPTVQVREGPRDLYREIVDALEDGGPGPLARVPVPTGEPSERVACLEGRPFLLKVTRFPRHYRVDELLDRQPQYFLELGFRCAALAREDGWLFLGYERAESPRDRLRVYHVTFAPIDPIAALAAERGEALARALKSGSPAGLPSCPGWMVSGCPYRERCGCGGDAVARSSP